MAPHTIILPPPCLTVGKRHSFLYLSPSLRRTYTLRLLPNCSNLDSSVHNTLYQSSFVHFLCSFANFCRFTLFLSFSNGFLAAILPKSPSSPSFRYICINVQYLMVQSVYIHHIINNMYYNSAGIITIFLHYFLCMIFRNNVDYMYKYSQTWN